MTSAEFFQIFLPFLLSPYQYKRPHNLPSFGKILGTTSLLLVQSANVIRSWPFTRRKRNKLS